MKLFKKVEDFAQRKLFKHFAKKQIKGMSDRKLNETFAQIVKVKNGQLHSNFEKWKIDLSHELLRKELIRRGCFQ